MDEHVRDLIYAVAADELIPRFRRLASSDVHDKSPGEVVTVADWAAEAALTEGLLRLLPGSVVVGEEASHRDPTLIGGDEHFALYYRTLAWDHAPGAFLAQQAGAAVHRFDGSRYNPGDGGSGLLVAADEDSWRAIHDRLLPQLPVRGTP